MTKAPAFELPTQKGERRSLDGFLQRGPVLLTFHRGTWCPNCRRRFGELAQQAKEYEARGVQLVTILPQRPEPVRRYIEETGLPFDILIDESRDVVRAYGVWHRAGLTGWNIAKPAVFLIDTEGTIRYSFVGRNQTEFPAHEEILREIERLKPPPPRDATA